MDLGLEIFKDWYFKGGDCEGKVENRDGREGSGGEEAFGKCSGIVSYSKTMRGSKKNHPLHFFDTGA